MSEIQQQTNAETRGAHPLVETMEVPHPVKATLQRFIESEDFKSGVINTTKAGRSGAYAVILNADTWEVVPASQADKQYTALGAILLQLPTLDMDASDLDGWTQDGNAEEEFYAGAFTRQKDELAETLLHSMPAT